VVNNGTAMVSLSYHAFFACSSVGGPRQDCQSGQM
jgi:hypothetical protein